MGNRETVLRMTGITKAFAGVIALDGVDFELKKGEIHSLIGENGAGKSTLMKVLLGMHKADKGTIELNNKEIRFKNPNEALNNGIAMIHQEISLIHQMTIAENIWLGREDLYSKSTIINVKQREKATRKLLDEMNITLDPNTIVSNLSVAQMQLVELVRAVSYQADIIIMDEPTSALTQKEIDILFKTCRSLAEKGASIVFISHKLEEVFAICERITVMRDGKYIGTYYSRDITQGDLIRMVVGRELLQTDDHVNSTRGEEAIRVEGLANPGVFNEINFTVYKGEILGFYGLMGAGRTEIMRAIFGLDPLENGKIYIGGKEVSIKNPQAAIANGIGMVSEDRLRMGAIYALSIIANTTLSSIGKICNGFGLFSGRAENNLFLSIAGKLSVKYASPKESIGQLSGGNQQKIMLSRWLLTNPDILILDEPTRGIDVGAKYEIYKLIEDLAKQGIAVILVSSELPEIMALSDRINVVRHGEIVFECTHGEADQVTLVSHAFGTCTGND